MAPVGFDGSQWGGKRTIRRPLYQSRQEGLGQLGFLGIERRVGCGNGEGRLPRIGWLYARDDGQKAVIML